MVELIRGRWNVFRAEYSFPFLLVSFVLGSESRDFSVLSYKMNEVAGVGM